MNINFKTAYPKLPENEVFKPYALQKLFSITEEEHHLSQMHVNGAHNQLNFLVLLKSFDFLNYFPDPHEIPDKVYHYVGKQLEIEDLNIKKISKTLKFFIKKIMRY